MKEELFAIKLGKNIAIWYEINGDRAIIKDKEKNSKFNYLIKIDDIEININEIFESLIEKKFGQINKDIIVTCINEIIKVEIIKSKKIYLLEHILIKLFEEIKQIVNKLINKNLNKAIIIINNLPNELILILHRAALLAKIQIIKFINLNKSIAFFLNTVKSA